MTDIDPYVAALPKAIVDIACGQQAHQLVWSGGVFTTLDHADPEGERVLSALGGENSRCIALLDAWHRRHHDIGLFTVASRGATDRLSFDDPYSPGLQIVSSQQYSAMTRARRATGHLTSSITSSATASGWVTSGVGHRVSASPAPESSAEEDYVMLLRLGGGLPERLIAEAAAHWSQRLEADDVEPADLPSLEAALYGRVLATTDTWLGGAANVELSMIGPHEDPYLHRQRDHVDLGLPFHWLSRVWAPGTSVMNGQLILDAHHAGDDTSLLATSPDGTLNTLTITRRPGGGR